MQCSNDDLVVDHKFLKRLPQIYDNDKNEHAKIIHSGKLWTTHGRVQQKS